MPLTKTQSTLYRWIFSYTLFRGYQPSVREMMERMKIKSPNGIMCHIHALEKKGYLKKSQGESRALRFLNKPNGQPFQGFKSRKTEDFQRVS